MEQCGQDNMKKKNEFGKQFKSGMMPQESVRYEDRGIGRYASSEPSIKATKPKLKINPRGR
jgi:hypothetical protein